MSVIKLTQQQLDVIQAPAEDRMLVQAGPGAGKTEVVSRRLAHLISTHKLRPNQILVLSFSRSAVKALTQRIRSLYTATDTMAVEELRFLSIRTFDSWTFRILRFLGHDPSRLLENEFNDNIKLLLNNLIALGPEGALRKPELNLSGLRHFIIDESQDLSGVRAALVKELLKILAPSATVQCGFTILGDPDQAIYDWSIKGRADDRSFTSRDLIDWIRTEYKSSLIIRNLDENHRCNETLRTLVKKASGVLRKCEEHSEDPIEPLRTMIELNGGKTTIDDIFNNLASESPIQKSAILCRGNKQIFDIAASVQYLSYKNDKPVSPFKLSAGTPPRPLPAWIAILLHQFRANQITRKNFIKIFQLMYPDSSQNAPCNGNAEAAWKLLLGYAREGEDNTSLILSELRKRIFWPDSLPDDEGEQDVNVTLTTIHQSKGLEYDSVQVVYNNSDLTDEDSVHADSNINEEGRVLFVGMSRARYRINLLDLNTRFPFYKKNI